MKIDAEKEIVGTSFKSLSLEQQKSLLLAELRESMKGLKPGAPFAHFFRYVYDEKMVEAAVLSFGQELGQEARYFPAQPPTDVSWVEFAGKPF